MRAHISTPPMHRRIHGVRVLPARSHIHAIQLTALVATRLLINHLIRTISLSTTAYRGTNIHVMSLQSIPLTILRTLIIRIKIY